MKQLATPAAKGILLTAGIAVFIGIPIACLAFIVIYGGLPGFWIGVLAALLFAFAVFVSWHFHDPIPQQSSHRSQPPRRVD